MAAIGIFCISPSTLISIINLFRRKYHTDACPEKDPAWRTTTLEVVLPVYNEEKRIAFCLHSLAHQVNKPSRIVLIDDVSQDQTIAIAEQMSSQLGLNLEVIRRTDHAGKTPAIHNMVNASSAEIIFVLDGDTILNSPNYIDRILEQFYENTDVAAVCGTVRPITRKYLQKFVATHAVVKPYAEKNIGLFRRMSQSIVNTYRSMLYQFSNFFIYRSQIVSMGTLVNPVGCAVGYRREYLKELFTRHAGSVGLNMTTSEDIFIGFSFNNYGYRSVQLRDIECVTQEPLLSRLPKQFYLWSSSFLQSCYYFMPLVLTPLKCWRKLFKRHEATDSFQPAPAPATSTCSKITPLPLGSEYTKKYGRPIGWYIFWQAFEKITYPIVLLYFLFACAWDTLMLIMLIETSILTLIVFITTHKIGQKFKNAIKTILITPLRYALLLWDIVIIIKFFTDLLFKRTNKWQK